jgi:hypothetical protein
VATALRRFGEEFEAILDKLGHANDGEIHR